MTETLPPVRSTNYLPARAGMLCYDSWGFHGRPILLIPTVLFGRTSWWPTAADLRPHATVVAVDLPGHGQSTARACYDPGELVDDLAALLNSLRIRRAPVVVGHGTSAVLATMFAARYATHAVVAVDPCRPVDLPSDAHAYLQTMSVEAVPEPYRYVVEGTADQLLFDRYTNGLRDLRPATATIGVNPLRVAVHSRPPEAAETDPDAARQWRHETYDVPGRFAHLAAAHRFVTDLCTLL
ncbi:alpha/beta fold hydrolase [Couchioplanes caeruleus]|uniref:alpha/beta fold hydrolase n=1 Tax=Couchioplanes caeruleus TaxID=56438 RepID=UPI0020BDFC51|nr:alpha/beta hydrolase [Couchioplanes caeruleus]UQU67487.1 alpha/beta fold hydrolase [Couchioplanes caeruleus]